MKEPYAEGLATHSGHESCAGGREATREALDSGMYRLGIEPRKTSKIRVPTQFRHAEGNIFDVVKQDVIELYVVGDPTHVQKSVTREPGDPAINLGRKKPGFALKIHNGVQQ